MRLRKRDELLATQELLAMLEDNKRAGGEGLRISQLQGTTWFHGVRTLTPRQITRLLRKTGVVSSTLCGSPGFSYNVWKLDS